MNTNSGKNVPSLEDLCFEASYKDLIHNLLVCNDHRPDGKKLNHVACSPLMSLADFSSQNVRDFVKARLNNHRLVGVMRDDFRKKYVSKFFRMVANKSFIQDIPDIWVFLDCVLDESFKELETHFAFPDAAPSPKLIYTIAKRSPELKKLKLEFQFTPKEENMAESIKSLSSSFSSLKHLTSLTLCHLDHTHISLLSHVAKSCASLTHLSVDVFYTSLRTVLLAIIMRDELVDIFNPSPKWFNEDYWAPDEHLTPLCDKLQDLELRYANDDEGPPHRECMISYYVVAFAMRHLRFLKTFECDGPIATTLAIKFLNDIATFPVKTRRRELQSRLENTCREVVNKSRPDGFPSPQFNRTLLSPYFSGLSKLTMLNFVPVRCSVILSAVGSTCPLLTDVVFTREYIRCPDIIGRDEKMSPEKLESSLSGWAKLQTIKMACLNSLEIKTILKVFGENLVNLLFTQCYNIPLEDLSVCNQLESLTISQCCHLKSEETDSSFLTSENFLPALKSFESFICLGDRSRLFEEKKTLQSLRLCCCHVGLKLSGYLDWNKIPQLWSDLETLHIHRGNEAGAVLAIVPQLNKLQEIALPSCLMNDSDEERRNKLEQTVKQISLRRPSLKFFFLDELRVSCEENWGYYSGKCYLRLRYANYKARRRLVGPVNG